MKNFLKIATGQQEDGYTTGCSLDYPYFNESYIMIAIDLRNSNLLIRILEQFNRLILLQI